MDDIKLSEVGEPGEDPTRVQKPPIKDLYRLHQAAMEVQPALADKGVGEVLGNWELGEDGEEKLIG